MQNNISPTTNKKGRQHSPGGKPLIVALFALLAIGSLAGAFLLGTRYPVTGTDPQEQASATVPVWGRAENRVVNRGINLTGTAKSAEITNLVTQTSGSPMVLSLGVTVGQNLASGDLLGLVGGQPIFVLDPPLPLYRELHRGDRGQDVTYFQQALAKIGYPTNTDGLVTETTLAAVTALYRSERLDIPEEGIETISPENFVPLPSGGGTKILQTAQIGEQVSDEKPLVRLEKSPPYIDAHVPVADIDSVEIDREFTAITSKGKTSARVSEIGDLVPGTEKTGAGYTVRMRVEDTSQLVADQFVSLTSGESQEKTLAVPSSAIKEDSRGTYVLADNGTEDPEAGQRVDVTVLHSADGYTAIDASIESGTKVLLQ